MHVWKSTVLFWNIRQSACFFAWVHIFLSSARLFICLFIYFCCLFIFFNAPLISFTWTHIYPFSFKTASQYAVSANLPPVFSNPAKCTVNDVSRRPCSLPDANVYCMDEIILFARYTSVNFRKSLNMCEYVCIGVGVLKFVLWNLFCDLHNSLRWINNSRDESVRWEITHLVSDVAWRTLSFTQSYPLISVF